MTSLVAKLRWGGRARLVAAALDAAGVRDGLVAVLDSASLADVLAETGRKVALVTSAKKAARGRVTVVARTDSGRLPFDDASLAAVVATASVSNGLPLAAMTRALRPGGAVVVVGLVPAEEASRLVLCGGFVDVEQRGDVTSGRLPAF